ncbi:MAG: DUF4190 domain-containing protein [Planctomycetota bacterium]
MTSTSGTAPTPDVKTSSLAIISLVLAVISPFNCLLSTLPAIILAIISLVKISKSSGQLKGKGLAITAIAISVALPFLVIVIGILRPEFLGIKQVSPRMICGANMSGLGKSILIYLNSNEDKFPTPSKWCDLLIEHTDVSPLTFRCKNAREGPCNYAMNKNIEEYGINSPPDMVLLFETHPGWNQTGGPEILTTNNHKGAGCNVIFVASYVQFIKTENLNNLKWEPD